MKNAIEILLISNDRKEQDIFSLALNDLHLDYMCRFAATTPAAIKILQTIIPDYVFVNAKDVKLKALLNLKNAKKSQNLKNTLFIAYSENISDKFNARALRLGAVKCINKTKTIAELIYTLKNIFLKDNLAFDNQIH